MLKNDVKYGAILSYVLIIMTSVYGFFITPFIISQLGNAEYGVYKTISSFSSAFMILDVGLGSTIMRYIAKFRADNEDGKIPDYIAMTFIQALILIGVLSVVLFVGYVMIDYIYGNGLTQTEINSAKELFRVFSLEMCLHIFSNVISGILKGYNKFFVSNCLGISKFVIRIILIITLLPIVQSAVVLVWINVFVTLIFIGVDYVYIKSSLKIKIRFTKWDNNLFKDSLKYTSLMFITSIIAQINNSLDNVFVGALIGSTAVAVYSIGLLFFSMYQQLSTSISSVMLPTVVDTLKKDDEKNTKTKDLVVSVGRIQFMLLAAALVGFIVVGKEFLDLWVGKEFYDAYVIGIILMAPSMFELCINVCLSILRAKNILGFRTCVLVVSTVINSIITVVGTLYFGYYAAAIGTGVSFFGGSVVVMGIYYYKKLNINVLELYIRIFKRTWICLILSGIVSYVVKLLVDPLLFKVVLTISAFIAVYAISLYVFALDENEKKFLKIDKLFKKKKTGEKI